jgi:hypothetical protein
VNRRIVKEFFLHRGRHDHYLALAAPSRLHQLAHLDLAGKTVLFPLPVALQQLIEVFSQPG